MKKLAGILGASAAAVSVVLWAATSAANASDFGPRHRRKGADHERAYSVAEPASIALLGAGLVSLGLFARKKLGKKP